MTEQTAEFSQEDLAVLPDTESEVPKDVEQQSVPKDNLKEVPKDQEEKVEAKPDKPSQAKDTISAADSDQLSDDELKERQQKKEEKDKAYWPDDWREKMAADFAAGDKKKYDKELKRLQRYTTPLGVYGSQRELETKFGEGGLFKVPAKDAPEEEVAAFHKALGVPEKWSEYFDNMNLPDGAVIGESDKPMADSFASAVHKTGARQETVDAAMGWFYEWQQKQAEDLEEYDDNQRREAEKVLKEEFGSTYKRNMNAIPVIYQNAEGGADISNEKSLIARLWGGRMSDGTLIGDDPSFIRWQQQMASEINPISTVVDNSADGIKSIETELADIRKLSTEDPKKYWSDPVQARELELIEAHNKFRRKTG